MARPDKAAAVAELTDAFRESSAAVLTEYRGLTVAQLKELRRAAVAGGPPVRRARGAEDERAASSSGRAGSGRAGSGRAGSSRAGRGRAADGWICGRGRDARHDGRRGSRR